MEDAEARVAHLLLFIYALRQPAQHLCPRVPTLARPGFLTVADIKGNVGAIRAGRMWPMATEIDFGPQTSLLRDFSYR